MEQFGVTCPATGFALGMERLMLSLEREGSTPEVAVEPDYLILYQVEQAAAAYKKARELREAGFVVVTHQVTDNASTAESIPAKNVIGV